MRNHRFLAMILLTCLIAGCFEAERGPNREELIKAFPETRNCLENPDDFMASECLRSMAKEKQNDTICLIITNNLTRNECVRDIAILLSQENLCIKIGDTEKADACLNTIALNENNNKICSKISSQPTRNRCLAHTLTDPAYCELIDDGRAHDWCLYSLMRKVKTSEICDNIFEEQRRDLCLLDYLKQNRLDATVCNRIRNESIWAECDESAIILTCPIESFSPKYGKPLVARR